MSEPPDKACIEILSDDLLIDLGAQLENDLNEVRLKPDILVEQLQTKQTGLLKPGVKLSLNTAIGIAGIALAPITLNISLILSIFSGVITVSDAFDFSDDLNRYRTDRGKIRRLRRLQSEIDRQLRDIELVLGQRLDERP